MIRIENKILISIHSKLKAYTERKYQKKVKKKCEVIIDYKEKRKILH